MKRLSSCARALSFGFLILVPPALGPAVPIAFAISLTVDSTGDLPDAVPGDGVCDDGTGACTLRAALQEANLSAGSDIITFDPALFGSTIAVASPLPSLNGNMTGILGQGSGITIDGGGAISTGLRISAAACEVYGLAITRFQTGLEILNGNGNFVGGGMPPQRNIFTRNGVGIRILGVFAEGNDVRNNLVTGSTSHGIMLTNGARLNTIRGNVCVDNGVHGILLDGHVDPGLPPGPVELNQILQNFVGMADATTPAPNFADGIRLTSTNLPTDEVRFNHMEGNVVSTNAANGITFLGSLVFGNSSENDKIGTDITGSARFGNAVHGVAILGMAHENTIGPAAATGSWNVISDNGADGVLIAGVGTNRNVIRHCSIGMDITAQSARGNAGDGVHMMAGARADTVLGCVISDNGNNGVRIEQSGTNANVVRDCFIGTDIDGIDPFGNAGTNPDEGGVLVDAGTLGNTIGPGNLVSDHGDIDQFGIRLRDDNAGGNYVVANVVGLNLTQSAEIPNYVGIYVDSSNNEIGPDNVVAGNDSYGIYVKGNGNDIFANIIGMDLSETTEWPNRTGVYLDGTRNNLGRGTTPDDGNIICANDEWGIEARNDMPTIKPGNVAHGNWIGITTGGVPAGNLAGGVWVACGIELDVIGTSTKNVIAHNGGGSSGYGQGVLVGDVSCGPVPIPAGVEIVSDSIYANSTLGIELVAGANDGIPAPGIIPASVTTTQATVFTSLGILGSHVQLFYDDAEEGRVLIAENTFVGTFTFTFSPVPVGTYLTATNTADYSGLGYFETSEFSDSVRVAPQTADVAAGSPVPGITRLLGARPNPFWSTTTIDFELASPEDVRVRIYNPAGRLVRMLAAGRLGPGHHRIRWQGRDDAGHSLASGIYLYQLEAGRTCLAGQVVRVE